jgi:hypothetical protein
MCLIESIESAFVGKKGFWGSKLFHANRRTDRQTDMTKLTVALRNFANPPEKVKKKEQNCFETLQS